MKLEARLFGLLTPFFLIVSAGYGIWSKGEPVGTLALLLVGGLVGMIGLYLSLVARRIDARPGRSPRPGRPPGARQSAGPPATGTDRSSRPGPRPGGAQGYRPAPPCSRCRSRPRRSGRRA